MINHIKKKHADEFARPFKCKMPECNEKFFTPTDLFNQLDDHVRPRRNGPIIKPRPRTDLQCPVCKMFFFEETLLYKHEVNKHPRKNAAEVYRLITNGRLSTIPLAKRNLPTSVVTTSTSLACSICGKVLRCQRNLTVHMIMAHDESSPIHKCDKCVAVFKVKAHLDRHMKDVHSGNTYKCEECGISVSTNSSFNRHKLGRCPKRFEVTASLEIN